MKNIRTVLILLIAGLSLVSCVKKEYDISKTQNAKLVFDPMLGAPLLYSSLMTVDQTLIRYMGADKVGVYPDKLVYLKYKNISMSIGADNIITLPESYTKNMTQDTINQGGPNWSYNAGTNKSTYSITRTYPFSLPPGFQIDSIIFNPILFNISYFNNTFAVTGSNTLKIEVLSLVKNGVPFSQDVPVTNPPSFTTGATAVVGYKLNLISNQYQVRYTLTLNGSLPVAGRIIFNIGFGALTGTNLDYKYIYGYMGQRSVFTSTATLPISLFSDAQGMVFEDPRVNVTVKNSFGIPMQLSFTNLSATSATNTNIPINITGNGGQDSILILDYILKPSDTGKVKTRTFNKDNSDIKNALNSQPKLITYRISAKINPGGKTVENLVKNDSKTDITMDVAFPLWGKCTRFGTNDKFGFDYGGLYGNASGIEFKVWINNGLPAGGVLTMIFYGEDSTTIIDRIATDLSIIEPAPVDDATGLSTGITEHTFTLKYYKLENLPKIKFCSVSTGFHTPYINGTDASGGVKVVKVMSDNTMQMKIGMKVKIEYKTGL